LEWIIANPSKLQKLSKEEHDEHLHAMKNILYQEVVGSLMYAIVATKSYLVFAVSIVRRFMQNPIQCIRCRSKESCKT